MSGGFSYLGGDRLSSNLSSTSQPDLAPFRISHSCLVAALLVLYLPETLATKLPDTIEEAVAQAGAGAGSCGGGGQLTAATSGGSTASLDVGYGKCPEFVCTVDGLIVSKDLADTASDSGHDQSLSMSHQGTLSTLRSVEAFCLKSKSCQNIKKL